MKKAYTSCVVALLLGSFAAPDFAHNVQGNASYPLQEDIYTPAPNLFTGSFRYSVPIETPSGRNGVQPKLALSYDSGGGAGWLGVGWDLTLGAIERSTKRGINYATDNYVLRLGDTAVELVPNGTSTTDFREKYQTAFYRITKFGTGAGMYWGVTDKLGTNYYFGKDASTSYSEQTKSSTEIFSWHLDSVVDSNGNTMIINYIADQGQIYPSSIQYTSASGKFPPYEVDFVLEPWGCDTNTDGTTGTCNGKGSLVSYRAGYKITTAKRLKTIKISGRSSATASLSLIRAYTLFYSTNVNTNRDQLTAVQEYGKDADNHISAAGVISGGTAMPPIAFAYSVAAASPSGVSQFNGPSFAGLQPYPSTAGDITSGGGYLAGDFNGDGRGDLVLLFSTGSGTQWEICLGNGFGLDCPTSGAGIRTIKPWFIGDFNGDGKSDFLQPDGLGWDLCISSSSGTAQAYSCSLSNLPSQTTTAQLGDFNGDGKTDLYFYNAGTPATGTFCFASGTSTFTCTATSTSFATGPNVAAGQAVPAIQVADVDGDRAADLIDTTNGKVCYSNGSGSTYSLSCTAMPITTGKIVAGDFNGDGLADLASLGSSSATVCLSKGTTRTFDTPCPPAWTLSGLPAGGITQDLILGDFNGDGRTDFMGRASSSAQAWSYCLSTGGNANFNCPSSTVNMTSNPSIPGDFSGDGTTDAWSFSGAVAFDALYSGQLTSITNGLGARISVHYTNSNSYYADVAYPSQLPYPVHVVNSINVCDQWSGSSCNPSRNAETDYVYYGGYYDVPSSEFRGFAKVVVTTPAGPDSEQTVETTTFNQGDYGGNRKAADAYLAGRPATKVVCDNVTSCAAAGVTQITTTYTYQDGATAPHFNPISSIKNETKFGGASIITTQEDRVSYDAYGNLTQVKQYGDNDPAATGDDRFIVRTYATGATNDWMVGLPISEAVYSGLSAVTANKISDTTYYYGNATNCATPATLTPAAGTKLQRISRKLYTTDPTTFSVVDTLIGHDALGNVLCTLDGNQNKNASGNTTTLTYDANAFFPLTSTNALNQTTVNEYYGVNDNNGYIGQLKSVTDPNGVASHTYDALGRISQDFSPLNSDVPAVTYSYPSQSDYGKIGIQKITRIVKANYTDATADQVYDGYFDGFGRIFQEVQHPTTAGGGAVSIVSDKVYDVRGQLYRQTPPYYSGNAQYWTIYSHDGLGRAIKVAYPDGSQSLSCTDGRVTVEVGRYLPTASSGTPNSYDHVKRSTRDGLGRLVKVEEYNPSTTNSITTCATTVSTSFGQPATTYYIYDPADRLTKVTDAAGNITAISYDSLGRKRTMNDPDMGAWSYGYDSNGNLITQTDKKGQIIHFHYDGLNRLTQKDYGGTNPKPLGSGDVSFYYDDYSARP